MSHKLSIPDRFTEVVLTHRLRVLTIFAVITVCAGMAVRNAPLRVSLIEGLLPDDTEYRTYLERTEVFGGDSDDLLYFGIEEQGTLFTPTSLNAIRAAADDIESIAEVKSVFTFVDTPDPRAASSNDETNPLLALLTGRADAEPQRLISETLNLRPWWPINEDDQSAVDLATIHEVLLADPIGKRLLSRDGNAHTMLVWLDRRADLANNPQSGIRQRIETILRNHGPGQAGIHSAGTQIVLEYMFDEVIRALVVNLPVSLLVVAVVVYVIIRRLSYVALTLAISGIASVWAMGINAVVFGEITLLAVAAPELILVIATADTIHLLSAFAEELQSGASREEAVRRVFRDVGGACVLTSVTTFCGFLSLMVVPAETLRHMAVACAVGVASALLLALTLVPMALTVLSPPPIQAARRSLANRAIDRLVDVCANISLSRPRTVIAVHAVVIVLALCSSLRPTWDADIQTRFPPQHPLRQSLDFFNDRMAGTSVIEIILATDPNRLLESDSISGLAEFERQVSGLPDVRDVVSVLSVFRVLDSRLGLASGDSVPASTVAADLCVQTAERIGADPLRNLIVRDKGMMRVFVRITSTRILEGAAISDRTVEIAGATLPSHFTVTPSGYYPIVGDAVRSVLISQLEGFGLCFVCVMAVVTIGIRNLRHGLLAVLPNLFPLLMLGGLLGVVYDVIDSDMLGLAIVSFSLAVDDTIHFLHRFDVEQSAGGDRNEALVRTFHYTGGAIVRTTVILGLGLVPFALSSYFSVRVLGTWLVMVLAMAVFGDLLLLPALLKQFGRVRPSQDHPSTESGSPCS